MTKSNFIRTHYFVAGSLAAITLLVVSAIAGQLVITSFDTNGNLTWTNSVSNATYRVQWASSVTGPWTNFLALTKLDSIQAKGNGVTVKVPMFYRVVATKDTDQNPEGTYLYKGYDAEGGLLNVGWLSLGPRGTRKGTWVLGYAGSQPSADLRQKFGNQFGEGELDANFERPPLLSINLNVRSFNQNVVVAGNLQGRNYTGNWGYYFFGPKTNGTFIAEKVYDIPRE